MEYTLRNIDSKKKKPLKIKKKYYTIQKHNFETKLGHGCLHFLLFPALILDSPYYPNFVIVFLQLKFNGGKIEVNSLIYSFTW